MKAGEPQSRLSRERRLVLFAAVVLALFLLGYELWTKQFNQNNLIDHLFAVLVALIVVEFGLEMLRSLGEGSERRQFRRFFGDAACKQSVHLVFAHWFLKDHLKDRPTDAFHTYHTPEPPGEVLEKGSPQPEGI